MKSLILPFSLFPFCLSVVLHHLWRWDINSVLIYSNTRAKNCLISLPTNFNRRTSNHVHEAKNWFCVWDNGAILTNRETCHCCTVNRQQFAFIWRYPLFLRINIKSTGRNLLCCHGNTSSPIGFQSFQARFPCFFHLKHGLNCFWVFYVVCLSSS